MRCEVIAVGTELLLGQIVDTNSSYIGEQLAEVGIDSHFQTKVGDNADRMRASIELALSRSEAVILCGGLGPTQDDITRNVIADVMGVELEERQELVERIENMFGSRGRAMRRRRSVHFLRRSARARRRIPRSPPKDPDPAIPRRDCAG